MSIKRGLARVQFIACHSEIVELLDKGYTVQNIYDDFVKSKKITMSYRIFAKYIRIRIKNAGEETVKRIISKDIQEKSQDKQENKKPKIEEKPQEKPVRVFSTPEKKKGFGSGLHRDADEVC